MSFHRIGIHWNSQKIIGVEAARRMITLLRDRQIEICVNEQLAQVLKDSGLKVSKAFSDCELLIVLGGDGTILRALEMAIPSDLPILGVNVGRIGFLAEVELGKVEHDLARVLEGDYRIDERMTMCVDGFDDSKMFALNDIVVCRATTEIRTISLEYSANGAMINRIFGDGLIIASTTGSTAYSLSAGGPVISPGLECFVCSPICPHMLNVRPVVLPSSDAVTVRILDGCCAVHVVLDGRKIIPMPEGVSLTFRRSVRKARFVRVHDQNYYELLRGKLSEWTR